MSDTDKILDNIPLSGVTEGTPSRILLGAGTIHRGLKREENGWNFADSLLCATSGGCKLTITPKLQEITPDGPELRRKGLTVKVGETAELEFHPLELTPEILKSMLLAEYGTEDVPEGYQMLRPKASVAAGDHLENLSYVGTTLSGTPVIMEFANAICTSGLTLETKSGEAAVPACTFACTAAAADTVLPWYIYLQDDTEETEETA